MLYVAFKTMCDLEIAKDHVLEVTTTGKPYSKCSLAVDQGKDQPPMWLNIITWEKLAETVAIYAYKGMQMFVQGKLVLRAYKDKNNSDRIAVDLVATTVLLLEKRQGDIPVEAGEEPTANK